MQLFIRFIFWCLILPVFHKAQSSSEGVYLTAADFLSNRISYQKHEGKKYKFRIHETIGAKSIKIVRGDSVFLLGKDSVFGYRDSDGNNYRLYERHVYKILNPKEEILIYGRSYLGGYKGAQTITEYFFSISASTPLHKLTKQNIKLQFLNKPLFIEYIDVYFRDDASLLAVDETSKIYLLNKVLLLSNKK